jgi:predicted site-specific integrase-resolvase
MSRKGKLVTPRQYAEENGVAYTTVMYWLNNGRVEGAVKHTTPTGHYWELPEDTPRPKKLSGRPKKAAKKKGAK